MLTQPGSLVQRSAIAAALAAALLTPACHAPVPLTTLDGVLAGTTTVRVANHLEEPAELDRIVITVDGATLPLAAMPPPGGDTALVDALRLAPGEHVIAVRVTARAPGGEVLVAASQQTFQVERGAAAIGVDVRSASSSLAGPVAVAVTMLGGRMSTPIGAPPPDGKDERCGAMLPIPRALCRASIDLEDATRRNDVVVALCVRDKLAELRRLWVIGQSKDPESGPLADGRARALAQEAERCIGDVVASPLPDGITVTRVGAR
jgi:hypothetical protein